MMDFNWRLTFGYVFKVNWFLFQILMMRDCHAGAGSLLREFACGASVTPDPLWSTVFSKNECAALCADNSGLVTKGGGGGAISCACYTQSPQIQARTKCPSPGSPYTVYKAWHGFLSLRGSTYCLRSAEDQGDVHYWKASSHCTSMGQTLPEVDSLDDLTAVLNAFKGDRSNLFVWLGAKRGTSPTGQSNLFFYWDTTGEVIPGDSDLWEATNPNLNPPETRVGTFLRDYRLHDVIYGRTGKIVCMAPCTAA